MERDWAHDELMTFIQSDADFSRRYRIPLEDKLRKEIKKDRYNPNLATALWNKLIDKAIQIYTDNNSEIFENLNAISKIFPKPLRTEIGMELREGFETKEITVDQLDHVIEASLFQGVTGKILADMYDKAMTIKDNLPRFMQHELLNARGFLSRIPDQKYYRPAPMGKIDMPTDKEMEKAYEFLATAITEADFKQKKESKVDQLDRVVNGSLKIALDRDAILELKMWIENDEQLYKQQRYMEDNLLAKIQKGVYDHNLSTKLWMYLCNAGAESYVKEFGGEKKNLFPVAERKELAQEFADDFASNQRLINISLKKDINKEGVSKTTLKNYGELAELLNGEKKVVTTEYRLNEIIEDLDIDKSWFKIEELSKIS